MNLKSPNYLYSCIQSSIFGMSLSTVERLVRDDVKIHFFITKLPDPYGRPGHCDPTLPPGLAVSSAIVEKAHEQL